LSHALCFASSSLQEKLDDFRKNAPESFIPKVNLMPIPHDIFKKSSQPLEQFIERHFSQVGLKEEGHESWTIGAYLLDDVTIKEFGLPPESRTHYYELVFNQ
jgi:hypothetical protein